MEYQGKLYGKINNSWFPLQETTEDFHRLEKEVKRLKEEVELLHVYKAKDSGNKKVIDSLKAELKELKEREESQRKGWKKPNGNEIQD